MRSNVGRLPQMVLWLGVGCLWLPLSPLSAQDPKPRTTINVEHDLFPHCIVYSPDGKTLASEGNDGTVRLWDVATGKERATIKGHAGDVNSVSYRPDGKTLASARDDNTILLWDVATGKGRATLKRVVKSVAYSPDGKTLASGGTGE